jgi:hypothetical protein
MKTKLTLTIDQSLLPGAKRYARRRGVSLSSLVENALREMIEPGDRASFSTRWRGTMALSERDDERYRYLMRKYE